MPNDSLNKQSLISYRPTTAYVGASWAALGIGVISYLVGLWNATGMALSEKGFYLAVVALGLYSAISLQKTVRDKAEGIDTSSLYYGISWCALGLSIILIAIGLFNAGGLSFSEKGFYMMAFTLSLFAAITIQKNTRDEARARAIEANASYTLGGSDDMEFKDDIDDKSLFNSLKSNLQKEDVS